MIHRPRLDDDPRHNRRALQAALDSVPAGTLELPPGTHVIDDGLTVGDGWTIRGAETVAAGGGRPASRLRSVGTGGKPVLHVLGSDVTISDLGLCPPPAFPGEHGGDRGTAVTVGEYLYAATPRWIGRIDIRRVRVERPGDRAANSIALMGAVRDVTLHDVSVHGGYTAVAVHWGAVGTDVSTIVGPTYHPHRLTITDLRVRDAIEGFYLSSVHDVRVATACLRDVEMGFRLLPGDNTDRFAPDGGADVGARISVEHVCTHWHGDKYGARVAGWGRSEIDGLVSTLRYTDTVIRDCVLTRVPRETRGASGHDTHASGHDTQASGNGYPPAGETAPSRGWAPVVLEGADGVELRDVRMHTQPMASATGCCPLTP